MNYTNTHVYMESLEESQDKSGRAIDNNKLRSAGYATLMETYLEWYPKSQQYKLLYCPRYWAI